MEEKGIGEWQESVRLMGVAEHSNIFDPYMGGPLHAQARIKKHSSCFGAHSLAAGGAR